ncbi:uncharacterized protein LOC116617333 [Nematostella vectensis]|uniref:uncharacterized protein LOC116617333 n=1 Tax=Nematostella vectensis TaxID=45351 RepID=UPI0020778669|nr:uncharacterized protein LOC116617333 [Nematostella vectensis]
MQCGRVLSSKRKTKMADGFRLNTVDLVEQIAVLGFINGGEQGKSLYNAFVSARVGYEIYKRITVSRADRLRAQTIARVAQYVKAYPKASDAQMKAMLEKEIGMFAQQVAQK